jgi:hypothetical protein
MFLYFIHFNDVFITWHGKLLTDVFDNIYIKMYSFVTRFSLKMAVMGRNMWQKYYETHIVIHKYLCSWLVLILCN